MNDFNIARESALKILDEHARLYNGRVHPRYDEALRLIMRANAQRLQAALTQALMMLK